MLMRHSYLLSLASVQAAALKHLSYPESQVPLLEHIHRKQDYICDMTSHLYSLTV